MCVGGVVDSWFVRSTPERAVRVRALAGDIELCSWPRHLTLTVPLFTQVYEYVPANCWGSLTKLRGSDLRWTTIPSRGSILEILLAASCNRNRDKLRQLSSRLGFKASLHNDRFGGFVFSVLSSDSSPGWGHGAMFVANTLKSHSASLHPLHGVQKGNGKI